MPDSTHTHGLTIYNLNTDSIYYQIVTDSKVLEIKTEKDFEIGLKGMWHGFEPKLARYAIEKNDTTISRVKGLFVFAAEKDNAENARQMFSFFTILNGHCCFIQCSTSLNKPAITGIRQFFDSARFKGKNYPAKEVSDVLLLFIHLLGYGIIVLAFCFFMKMAIRKFKSKKS